MADSNIDISVNADTSGATQALDNLNDQLGNTEQQLGNARKASQALGKQLTNIGSKIAQVGKVITTAVTLPILGMATASIKMASDFNENINKVDVIFKNNSAGVKTWAKGMIDNFGIAEGSALQMVSMFGDMGTSMGLGSAQATSMSEKLVELAGDMASFKNLPLEQAQTALQGIFTGEGEALKSLGIAMTVANLEAYSLSTGHKKLYKEMSEAEKIQLRYAYILSVTKASQGDFARTSEQLANASRTVGQRLKELGQSIGERLIPVVTPVVLKFGDFLKKLKELSPQMKDTIIWFSVFLALLGPVAVAIGVIVTIIGVFMTAGLTLTLWVSGAVIGFTALVAVAVLIIRYWDAIKAKTLELATAFMDFKDKALVVVKQKFDEFKKTLSDNEATIKAFAIALGVTFAPALIATGVQAVIQGAIITGSFVASIVTMGAEAIKTGVIMGVTFVGQMIKAGIQAVATGAIFTVNLIKSLVSYAANAWIAVIRTTAMSVAWAAQKIVMLASAVAMGVYNVAIITYNAVILVATTVTSAFGAVMALICSPIGVTVIAIAAVIAICRALYQNWDTLKAKAISVFGSIKDYIGSKLDWVSDKIEKFKKSFSNMFSGIKLPHFTFTGSMNPIKWATEGMPELDVSYHADGGIFNKPTLLGGNHVVGEAGAEAIIPLSNKSKVAPFANAVASSFLSMLPDNLTEQKEESSSVIVQVASLVVREEADIDKIAEKLHKLQEKTRRGRGGHAYV